MAEHDTEIRTQCRVGPGRFLQNHGGTFDPDLRAPFYGELGRDVARCACGSREPSRSGLHFSETLPFSPAPAGHLHDLPIRGKRYIGFRDLCLFWILFWPMGCSSLEHSDHLRQLESHPTEGAFLSGVPFVKLPPDRCGEAALLTIIEFWGIPGCGEEALFGNVSGDGRFPFELTKAASHRGFAVRESAQSSLASIGVWLDSGCPSIVMRSVYGLSGRGHHFDVIVGYDDRERVLCRFDGTGNYEWVDYESFRESWTGFQLVILPQEFLADAIEGQQAEEEGRREDALTSYRKHLARFKGDTAVAFNLARLEEPSQARPIYEAILALQPDDGPSLNNLAHLVAKEWGDKDWAAELLIRAIERDPRYRSIYERSAKELKIELEPPTSNPGF